MIRTVPTRTTQPRFFLSYAHSTPLKELPDDVDPAVRRFFGELCDRVAAGVGSAPEQVGMIDYQVPAGADWKIALGRMIGSADAFVPLYSPGYFRRSWPVREHASFLSRLAPAGVGPPGGDRLIPLLWVPLPDWERVPQLAAALEIGAGIAEYAENGLRALCRLASFREHYDEILQRVARRLVDVLRSRPLPVATDLVVGDAAVPDGLPTGIPLVVAVVALRRADLPSSPEGRDRYGPQAAGWRPFGGTQEAPLAEYAVTVAERLGLAARVVDHWSQCKAVDDSPAIVLIDPWALADGIPDALLPALVGHVHPWLVPVLVIDERDPRYAAGGTRAVQRAVAALIDLGLPPERRVTGLEDFVTWLPALVRDARRRFQQHSRAYPPPGASAEVPRLTDPDPIHPLRPQRKHDE